MTVLEAARTLGLTRATIYNQLTTGRLPGGQGPDGSWFVDDSAVLALALGDSAPGLALSGDFTLHRKPVIEPFVRVRRWAALTGEGAD